MKITSVETLHLRLPDVAEIADGTQDVLVVRIATDTGHVGIGEVTSQSYVCKAIFEAPRSAERRHGLAEILVGQQVDDLDRLWKLMYYNTNRYGRRGAAIHAISGADIVVTATTAREPLFDGRLIAPGTHLNVIGSNQLAKAEVDAACVTAATRVACDRIDQCRIEAGELVRAVEAGTFGWADCLELADIVAGSVRGRDSDKEITLFKSVGLAIEDVALAAELIQRAENRQVGTPLALDTA